MGVHHIDDGAGADGTENEALTPPGERISQVFRTRLNDLFATAERRGERITNREIVRWMSEHGYPIKDAYLSQLRSGRAGSPSLKVIEGLSAYFGVDSSTFLTSEVTEPEINSLLEKHGVRSLATRAAGLSEENLDAISRLLDRFREAEGLPPIPDDDA
ncbi:helix-turn-helix domain-containing protein [Myceligenerans crystallogenes]|uniref:Transcriptional regulator n=1 Tax=Myceligenerans crystallogenes TaxID=316335 RepID=A0ABN2N6S9_9MICO